MSIFSVIFILSLCFASLLEASTKGKCKKKKCKLSSSSSSSSSPPLSAYEKRSRLSLSLTEPASSSSKPLKRYKLTEAGDETPFVPEIDDSILFKSSIVATSNPIPTDLYANGEETRRLCADFDFSSALTGNENTLALLLMSFEVSSADVAKALEYTAGDLTEWSFLHGLPRIYIKNRAFLPFQVFMRRFKYPPEFKDPTTSTPIACLAQFILSQPPEELCDLTDYFKVLLETQLEAVHSYELYYLNLILKAGTSGIPFLKLYFEYARSEKSSSTLCLLLLSSAHSEIRTLDFFKAVLAVPGFDPNARINKSTCKGIDSAGIVFKDPEEDYCLLSGIVTDATIPVEVFFCVYDFERVNSTAPTGKIFLRTTCPDALPFMRFDNWPLLFFAFMLNKYILSFGLTLKVSLAEFLESIVLFIWYIIWRSLFGYYLVLRKFGYFFA